MFTRHGFLLHTLFTLLVAAFWLQTGCRSATPKTPQPVEKTETEPERFSLQNEVTEAGETHTSREVWSLLPGTGTRRYVQVMFTRLGRSRTIFTCNNNNTYEVFANYQLTSERQPDGSFKVVNVEKKHQPGPCDGELPDFVESTWRLAGPPETGRHGNYLIHRENERDRILWAHTPTGSWVYRRLTPVSPSEQKVELELWSLVLSGKDRVTGHYDRVEIRESSDRHPFSCNGQNQIILFTRFQVEGKFLSNGQIRLQETRFFTPQHHPCDRTSRRYMDTYSGILIGDTIRLKTRDDDLEQILNRRHGL